MIRDFAQLLLQYSPKEVLWLFYSSLSYRIAKKIPVGFKESRDIFPAIMARGFKMERQGKNNRIYWKGYKLDIRRNTSDVPTFLQVMIEEEYRPAIRLFVDRGIKIRTMIDVGSNIGLTSFYVLQQFNESKIIAVEPNTQNCTQIAHNIHLNEVKNITLVKAGVWNVTRKLTQKPKFGDGRHWAFSLMESDIGTFQAFDIETLIFEHNLEVVDFLKIDIEGAEEQVFLDEKSLAFLNKVNVLAIEIHDRATIHKYVSIFIRYNMLWFLSAETLIAYRNSFI